MMLTYYFVVILRGSMKTKFHSWGFRKKKRKKSIQQCLLNTLHLDLQYRQKDWAYRAHRQPCLAPKAAQPCSTQMATHSLTVCFYCHWEATRWGCFYWQPLLMAPSVQTSSNTHTPTGEGSTEPSSPVSWNAGVSAVLIWTGTATPKAFPFVSTTQ